MMGSVTGTDPVSSGGFASAAGNCARLRPAYARGAVGRIAEVTPPGLILDVGAGTGILTGQLRRAGRGMLAAEPVVAMLAQLVRALPGVPAVAAVAEALPFGRSVLSGVTIAQAFHCMDHPGVLAEARRVLGPGGVLALVWNVADESVPWVRELTELIESRVGGPPCTDRSHPVWDEVVGDSGGFVHIATDRYPNPVVTSRELVIERVRSTSSVATMDPPARESLLGEVNGVLARSDQIGDRERFDHPHQTVVHLWRAGGTK